MDKFPILWKEKPSGELIVEKDALYTWFTVRCRLPGEGLWCAWAIGSCGELRLGVLEPAGECAVIRRRFSDRMVAPLGVLMRGEVRPALGEEKKWESTREPERLFETIWLQSQLRGKTGILTRKNEQHRFIAVPYNKKNPFPLVTLFCFSKVQTITGKEYAIFAFDEKEHPIFW